MTITSIDCACIDVMRGLIDCVRIDVMRGLVLAL